MQVAELARGHTKRVLILPRQQGAKEFVVREGRAQALDRADIRQPEAIARELQRRIRPASYANHQGKRLVVFPAVRHDRVLDDLREAASFEGNANSGGSETMQYCESIRVVQSARKRRIPSNVSLVQIGADIVTPGVSFGAVFGQSRTSGSMRSAATKRGSRVKPRSQTGRSRSSNGEFVMQILRTLATSRQRSMKSSTFHFA